MRVTELRDKYPVFEYKSFAWNAQGSNLRVHWEMEAGDLRYWPEVTIYDAGREARIIDKREVDNLVFHLGLAEIFSYWKATCSPTIEVSAGYLDEWQVNWWQDLLVKGMGQYFYENSIDFTEKNFLRYIVTNKGVIKHTSILSRKISGVLVPVGGGKDSAVTLELLSRRFGIGEVSALGMNLARAEGLTPSIERIVSAAGVKDLVKVKRRIDPLIFELNKKGYLNGHVPFTAYLSFLSLFCARILGYSTVVFSNERSANEGNLTYLGLQINHQYSKTFEFEQKFQEYNHKYLTNVSYFSFLRPLYELQTAKLFSQMDKYFTLFRSCNIGYKTDSWCCQCAKCLGVFIALYPFVKTEKLVSVFGHNLLEDRKLLPTAIEMFGAGKAKPFDCLGTFEETVVAFYLCMQRYPGKNLPVLLDYYKSRILPQHPKIEEVIEKILNGWDKDNNLPDDYKRVLKKIL